MKIRARPPDTAAAIGATRALLRTGARHIVDVTFFAAATKSARNAQVCCGRVSSGELTKCFNDGAGLECAAAHAVHQSCVGADAGCIRGIA